MFEAPERKGETVEIDADMVAAHLESQGDSATDDRAPMTEYRKLFGNGRRLFSFEFFPPKTDAGRQSLERTIRELAELEPAFVSVTYGAGGSTRAQTVELVQWIQREARLTAMAHLTCVGRDRRRDRRRRRPSGRRRDREHHGAAGRSPGRAGARSRRRRAGSTTPPTSSRSSAAATAPASAWAAPAAPRGTSSAAIWTATSMHLKAKVDAGLDFVVTQLFFDNRVYFDFVARARAAGITVPIVPGLMPIRTVAGIERMTKLSAAPRSRRR